MRHQLIAACALVVVALAAPPTLPAHAVAIEAAAIDPAALGRLRDGDVIFLSAPDALWARLASRWSLPAYRHGHVGMVVLDRDGRPLVVHAGGDPTRRTAVVRAVKVDQFLHEATAATVFRMRHAAAARAAAREALGFARRAAPFDTEFSLHNGEKLYCTELVWRALSSALRRDVVPVKARAYARPVIRLSDLEASPDLRLVARVAAPL